MLLTKKMCRMAAGAALTVSGAAMATNGYSPTGFGTTNKGMAGAGVALPQDAMAGATNPAGISRLDDRIDIGLGFFAPDRGFTADDNAGPPPAGPGDPSSMPPGTYTSDNDLFLVPYIGWNHRIDERQTVGVLLGGNGGMNTEYDSAIWRNFGANATAPTGVDFSQLFLGVPYAYQVNDRHSIGVMPIIAVQRFKAEGLEPFKGFSVDPENVTNNGYDYAWGYGIRIGWLGDITDRLTVGVSAQSRLEMQEFDDYAGLFAEQGNFDVPPTVTAGLSFEATPQLTLAFDWQRIFYGDVASLSNPNAARLTPDRFLGADNGLGFGWDDIDIWKLGVQWQYNPKLTLRAGVSYADQLFDNGQALFNVLAPATPQTHASLGFSYAFDRKSMLTVAYTHAFENSISGQNPGFTGPQTGDVRMSQNELEVGWSWRFD